MSNKYAWMTFDFKSKEWGLVYIGEAIAVSDSPRTVWDGSTGFNSPKIVVPNEALKFEVERIVSEVKKER